VTTVEHSVDIRAPIDAVFAALTDPRRGPEWNTNILDVAGFSGYPLQVGSTWRQTMMMMGRPTTLNCRIAQWDPPYEGLLEISGGQRAQVRTQCRPVGASTRVTQVLDFVPPGGALGRLAANLAVSAVRREMAVAMERQRAALEREIGASGGSRTS